MDFQIVGKFFFVEMNENLMSEQYARLTFTYIKKRREFAVFKESRRGSMIFLHNIVISYCMFLLPSTWNKQYLYVR